MNIQVIASSSSGNAVLVDDGHFQILLDAGIPYQDIFLKVRPSNLSGIFVTHEHMDHCMAVPELIRRGSSVFMSYGTRKAIINKYPTKNIDRAISIRPYKTEKVGSFEFMGFPIKHDSEEPFGFLIHSMSTREKLLYITDAGDFPGRFKDINYLLIEANYSEEYLEQSPLEDFVKNRIRRSHLSIEQVEGFLKQMTHQQLYNLDEIHLLHLSEKNSNLDEFKKRVQRLTGIPVYTDRNPEIDSWT